MLAGVIICEGAEEDAAEFVHRLRELRWKVCASDCHVGFLVGCVTTCAFIAYS